MIGEFLIYWDEENQIPIIIDEEKDRKKIKDKNLKYIAKDLRPVFLEEKHLIKNLFNWDDSTYTKSIWCTKQGKYIVNGSLVKESFIKSIKGISNLDEFRKKILSFIPAMEMEEYEKNIILKFTEENREHFHYLLESEDLDEEGYPIGAYPFIEKVVNIHKKRVPMVSFSGGKDSTAVSHLVRKALNNPNVLHIFGDTTLELPLTYEYVEKFKESNPYTPFFDERNEENNFFEMCEEIGPPSRVKSWCCSIFKTGPMGTTLSNFEEEFLTFYGVRRKESVSRSKYKRVGKTPKIHGGMVASPVIDWLDLDIWLYILTEDILFNESYRKGFSRVGCWLCPNNSDVSQFLAKLYVIKNENNNLEYDAMDWENFIYRFAEKIVNNYYNTNGINISKEELENEIKKYVENSKWKARQGGDGLEKSKSTLIKKEECINEKNTYIFKINRNIDEEFITLFKPFGKHIFMNKGKNQELIVLNKKEEVLFKLLFIEGEKEVRLTIVNLEDKYLYGKVMKQFNKFNTCIYCQACNSTCSFGALSVINGKYTIDTDKCVNCLNCVTKFDSGCLVASALKTKNKE
ncbi:phosphoadenosine phosphosulfate reductase family protein [Cetobacterium sp. SF1]|uniref:phosphoadenosine phosphosulfate reductase domain-containing protein n=1 Tax=Cetobacterium sp. SF1 TaxID=3417654 RepID=UPI003CE77C15